jgi:GT2 family glycosyltransferase
VTAPGPAETAPSRVTIVVMTRDRWPDLRESLARHEAPVIVVDNGSTDGTPDLVRRSFPAVEVVELASNQGAVARTVGVRRASTPYVAFADDDSWWAPGALAAAVALLDAHPRLAVLAGRMLVGPEELPDPICDELQHSPLGREPDLPGRSILGFLACGAVVRRSAYLEAGGFDDLLFFMGEEELLALDLASRGWGLCYVDGVVAHHHPSPVRDTDDRRARAARNRLLTAVMRRPWPVVLRLVAGEFVRTRSGRLALRQVAKALPEALRRRRRVPARVESSVRRLEAAATAP